MDFWWIFHAFLMDFVFWGGPGVSFLGCGSCMEPTPGPRGKNYTKNPSNMGHFRSIWGHLRLIFSIRNFYFFNISKSVRNRPENTPKPSQNHPQTIPNPSHFLWKVRFFSYFFWFFCDGFMMVWGWFWDGLGLFSGRFRTYFEKSKNEGPELRN